MTGSLQQHEAALDLDELVEQMETIDWRDVPSISSPEAAVWTQRCLEALDELQVGGSHGD